MVRLLGLCAVSVTAGISALSGFAALAQVPPTPVAASPPAAQPQQKLARIWANEPPLVGLARDRFRDTFSEADAKFFAAVAANEWADFRPSPDAKYDVTEISSWEKSPQLPANRIEWLCTDQAAARLVPSHGVWLRGVQVIGKINLYRYNVPFSLTFYDCLLNDGLNIANAKLQELDIRNSCSAAITGREVVINENVYLIESAVFGGVHLPGGQIAGDFHFSGGLAFHGRTSEDLEKQGTALELFDAKIGGDVNLDEKFRAFGQVLLTGAQIGRSLNCTDGRFVSVGQTAIEARACQVGSSAKFTGDFRAEGGINVNRMRIGGDLDCDGGRFLAHSVDALSADLVNVGGQVLLGDGFYAEGEVRLINASVAGNVDCDSGTFHHPDGDALSLDGAAIGRGLHIGTDAGTTATGDNDEPPPHFIAHGTIRLLGTEIGSDIFSDGGELLTPAGTALLANNVRVGSRVVLTNLRAAGTVNLSSAQIAHELDLRGSRFDGREVPDRSALVCSGMRVEGHLYSSYSVVGEEVRPFHVDGLMSVMFATIGMHWDLAGAEIVNPEATALDASDTRVGGYVNLHTATIDGAASFSRAKIDGMWVLLNTQQPERLTLDLRFAHIWVIKDEKLVDWPPAGQLKLEGLVYDHFDDDSPLDVEDRLAWLARQYQTSSAVRPAMTAFVKPRQRAVVAAGFQQENSTDQRPSMDSASEDSARDDANTDTAVKVIEDALAAGSENRQYMMAGPDEGPPIPEPAQMPAPDSSDAAELSPTPPIQPPAIDPAERRYVTQPYTQLAAVYRAIGQDEQASRVLVARAERLGDLSAPLSAHGIWYRYVGRLIGYGYEPFRAVKIGAGIVLLGAIVFTIGNRRHLMAETKLAEHVLSHQGEPRIISPAYPRFNPLVYSLDVFLPFVDLQQICYWLPGENSSGPQPSRNCLLHLGPWSLKWSATLRLYFWFQTLAGWTLCTLLAAAVTGLIKS
jgi:hypothetical protein